MIKDKLFIIIIVFSWKQGGYLDNLRYVYI